MKTVKAKVRIAGKDFSIDLKVEDVKRFIKVVELFDVTVKSLKMEWTTKEGRTFLRLVGKE